MASFQVVPPPQKRILGEQSCHVLLRDGHDGTDVTNLVQRPPIPTLCSIWIWSRGRSQTSSSWAVQLCTTQPLSGQFVIPLKALSIHRGFLPKSEQQTGPREESGLCFVWQLYTEVRIPRRFHELHFCNRKLHS